MSELLRQVRLEGALFLHAEFRQPWCVSVPPSLEMAPVLRPGATALAIVHFAAEGRCWVRVDGQPPLELREGDVAVFPQGHAHLIGSGPQHAPVELHHMVDPRFPCLERLRYGGDGEACLLVCGWLAFGPEAPNPLVASLPSLFRAPLGERSCAQWLRPSLAYALGNSQDAAGGGAVSARMAEALFLEAVRCYLESQPHGQEAWLAGLRDPNVRRCLALLHERPAHPWTVDDLAREVHLSRSVVAGRFAAATGLPPMQYLKRLRLSLAARLLTQERAYLARVAQAVGYASEAAFIRAFKSEYGVTPGEWRQQRSAANPQDPA